MDSRTEEENPCGFCDEHSSFYLPFKTARKGLGVLTCSSVESFFPECTDRTEEASGDKKSWRRVGTYSSVCKREFNVLWCRWVPNPKFIVDDWERGREHPEGCVLFRVLRPLRSFYREGSDGV